VRFWNCCAVSFQFGLDGVLKAFCGRGNGRSVHENAPGLGGGDALRVGTFFERRRRAGFINPCPIRQKLIGPRCGGQMFARDDFSSPLDQRRWKMQRVRLNPGERSRRKSLDSRTTQFEIAESTAVRWTRRSIRSPLLSVVSALISDEEVLSQHSCCRHRIRGYVWSQGGPADPKLHNTLIELTKGLV
jgi:hypothetical protein